MRRSVSGAVAPVPGPADRRGVEWHARSIEAVAAGLGVDLAWGLSEREAARRRQTAGANRLVAARRVTFWRVFAEEVREPMILLLVAVAVLYSAWGRIEDAVTIVVVIAAVVCVEVFTEFRAKAAVAALSQLTAPTVPAVRAGRVEDLPAEALVPGDVVLLRPGGRIPADVRLIEAGGLRVDESALSGESLAVGKNPGVILPVATPLAERQNLAFAGTVVAAGSGRAVVVATGMATELGQITGLVGEAKPPRTPLQLAMRELAGRLAYLAIAFSILIPLLGIAGGQPLRQMVLTGLTLAFATIPEELPILVTMVLGLGAWRLSRRRALIRRLRAAETLGEVSVIVTDKTGTLTENRMTVTQLWTGRWRPVRAGLGPPEQRLLGQAALCNDTSIVRSGTGLQIRGDPIDAAVIRAAGEHVLPGSDMGARERSYGLEPGHPLMSAIYRDRGGRRQVVTKGAPEAVLARCSAISADGTAVTLDPDTRADVQAEVTAMAAEGSRLVAVADRDLPDDKAIADRGDAERDLVLLGLIALADPARPEVAGAIETVRAAGIRVVMVTGDHPATAASVARAVGLNGRVLRTGAELAALDEHALDEEVASTTTFARVTPADKLRIVEAFRRRGETVAVTGDGINDAPALSRADIGVAMGDGTDVAKEAADMILADDNFATVAAAVREGRHLFDNLRKGIRYYLACKVALIASAAAGVIAGLPVPFAPVQIVVMEAFMDLAASTTFVAEPPEAGLMARGPRNPGARFMDRAFLKAMTAGAATLFAPVTGIYLWASASGHPAATAQTLAFAAWMAGYIALAWVLRSERTPPATLRPSNNTMLALWTAVTWATLALVISLPALRHSLKLTGISASQWVLVTGLPVAAVVCLGLWSAHNRRHQRPDKATARNRIRGLSPPGSPDPRRRDTAAINRARSPNPLRAAVVSTGLAARANAVIPARAAR